MTAGLLKKNITWLYVAVFFFAFIIRFYSLGAFQVYSGDEDIQIPTAYNYTAKGFLGPDNWFHPPLQDLLLYGSIKIFGDNPVGWRMVNVFFGSAAVVVLFALAVLVFDSLLVAVTAGMLLLLDPLHIFFSRSSMQEIPAGFFLLAAVYCLVKTLKTRQSGYLFVAGVLLGLSISEKWYALMMLPAALAVIGFDFWKKQGALGALRVAAYLLALPLTIYVLVFIPWFMRGYSLTEWLQFEMNAFWTANHMTLASFANKRLIVVGKPITWFFKFVGVYHRIGPSSYMLVLNNLPVWLFMPSAAAYLAYRSIKEKKAAAMMIGLSFWSIYLSFILMSRPLFIYSSILLLPFGFLAIGYGAQELLKKNAYLFLAVLSLWSLALYPLVAGIGVPRVIYAPLIGFLENFLG